MNNKRLLLLFIGCLAMCYVQARQLTQTVRGTLTDADSRMPLIGATVTVVGSTPKMASSTDKDGKFRFTGIPTGRIVLQLTYLGYETRVVPDIVVNSGKEVVLDLTMQESTVKMTEVVITANQDKGRALNEMALVSTRSISPDETSRYAGGLGFNDPSQIISSFAGVANNPNGNNDIIVRGNSPKYVQWRLEGVQITNPNHFADQGAIGGGLSSLNNNILATSDFYTGAFAPEFGDVLSGVYDVKLRAGNNEKFEAALGAGIMGTDLTLEGPFKKGYGGSFLLNYRYSTIGLLTDLGLTEVKGNPNFQDAAFKIMLPAKKAGSFSLFGLGGKSHALLEEVDPDIAETPGDRSMLDGIREDMDKGSHLLNLGLNHTIQLGTGRYLQTTLAHSREGIEDQVFESMTEAQFDGTGTFIQDSVLYKRLNYDSRLYKNAYRGAVTFSQKVNARNKFELGTQYTLFDYDYHQSQLQGATLIRQDLVKFNETMSTLRSHITWKHRFNDALTLVAGAQHMKVENNDKQLIEPRISFNWRITETKSLQLGYGKHSTLESPHNYFAKVVDQNGNVTEPNRNLDLLKADHFVIGYEQQLSDFIIAKIEGYYQHLYDLPVENDPTSSFATINEGPDFRYVELVNKGTGKNYGVELTLERFFNNNFYYLINGSVYNSTYKTLEGKSRNTAYNGRYQVNLLFGKEFPKLGRSNNQTLGLNAKVFLGGGRNVVPLLRDANGNLAVDPANNQFWDYEKAYEKSLGSLSKFLLSASYKWNKTRTTHELFLNLDNVTNTKGKLTEYYDPAAPGKIGYTTQMAFTPNFMYRLYF